MVGHKDYWFGKEIEGRLYGIATMFVDNIHSDWEEVAKEFGVPHIYYTDGAVEQLIVSNDWSKSFYRPWQVTMEVNNETIAEIPAWVRINVHLFYCIYEEKEISYLKNTDSIKIIKGEYNLLTATVDTFQQVLPEHYANDKDKKA